MRIGFIGLGVMGKHMAMNLLEKGCSLCVCDVVPETVREFEDKGAKSAVSPKEVAQVCDIVMMSLPNSQVVLDVCLGENGLLQGAQAGTLLVDLSSIMPKTIRKISEAAGANGVSVLDAPVSGGSAGAQKGTLTIMAGGSKDAFERAKPYLDMIGSKIYHVGDVGAGDTVKLINNLLLGANMAAVCEAFALGEKAGLDAQVLFDVVSQSSGQSYALTAKYPNFIAKRHFDPGFMIDLQYKDLQLAVDTAKDYQMPLLMGNVAQQMFEVARSEGMGKEDISALIKLYERWADKQ